MGTVVVDISMSLDGFVAAAGADAENGLGAGGQPIHAWVHAAHESPRDAEVLDSAFAATGAVVMGRRLFDFVDGPNGWKDDVGYGYVQDQSTAPPNFVVTHRPPAETRLRSGFTFVTGGVARAVEQARATAGDREVVVMGGASVCRQSIQAGLVDEIRIHLSPILVGSGTRLFDGDEGRLTGLEQYRVIETPYATHLYYRLAR
ncbi:dihydrofolate reductase family protein [Haloechinothrix sp. YIM 98757]|uniref:Dihydrofolate reductase family protein n=1 Tax=Haloechinothrix aidingensis TaxID=2752311 RepID=A0A838AG89_9PSEU|nr:dihydrofolate reductase family protein [Haloechinothrix aidingensis]MBA0128309.1 dihydrofolate reductase family protein [Haloechinothrix aidingensis]